MSRITLFILFLLINGHAVFSQANMRLGFGSCNNSNANQAYWQVIDAEKLYSWIWLGDIVYADSKKSKKIRKKYNDLKSNEYYKTFDQHNLIYGIWDDHDYGANDGGVDFKAKRKSRDILFDFLELPDDHDAWSRPAAYQTHELRQGELTVQLILLDVRYYRDKLKSDINSASRYKADEKAKMLGEEQWQWLAISLKESEADLIIIGSGTQVIPLEQVYEKWADYPTERLRLINLIKQHTNKKILLFSGDRHMAEVSAIDLEDNYTLFEITSSGLTHSWTRPGEETNSHRIGRMYPQKNYGTLEIFKNGTEINVTGNIHAIDGTILKEYPIFPQ